MDDKRLDNETKRILKQLQQLFYNNYLSALNIAAVRNSLSGNKPFWFTSNRSANKEMDKLLADFNKKANALFLNGIDRSWKYGEESYVDKIHLALSKNARQRKWFDQMRAEANQEQRNQGSAAAARRFADTKRGGINLSSRVWKLGNGMKQEIEVIIQNGMKEGKSADQLSQMLRKHLNDPDASFRRVRDKQSGELEMSEAAKKYNPGQGVYRSAYKNAMRLARTEIAGAYRRSQWEQFQNDPMVIGIRIELSNNHTCLNPKTGKPEPFYDICDELAGIYPKSFLWTGWHPQCRCIQVPILVGEKDFKKLVEAKVKGETYIPKQITEPPKALNEWVKRNKERAKGWENMPYWVKDNRQFVKDFEVNTYTPEEYTFTHARKTAIAMSRAIEELHKLYPQIENTELAAIHHYTKDQGSNYRQLNKQLEKGKLTDFNRSAATLMNNALDKLPAVKGSVYGGVILKQKDFDRIFGGDIGSTVKQNRFISSSLDTDVALNFAAKNQSKMKRTEIQVFFEIESKNGRDISKISELNGIFNHRNQKEVLFTNNTSFRIESREKSGNVVWIKLTEI